LLVFAIRDSVEEIEVMVPQGGKFEFLYIEYPVYLNTSMDT
jgi:hypothetical protein